MKTILWLASYPKSGNTWLRLFLFNYLFDPDVPAPINQAHRVGPGDATAALYRAAAKGRPFDPRDTQTALTLRPNVIAAHAGTGAAVNFMKTHNANIDVDRVPLIPPALTRGALYVIRDPLDMAVSFAHHYKVSHDHIVEALGSAAHATTADDTIVRQYLGNWSKHVRSWERAKAFPTKVIRYEDMTADPHAAFAAALKLIGAPVDDARLDKAIRFSSFTEAQKQETEHGFVEKPDGATRFFRSGKTGEGREALSTTHIARIERDHEAVMRRHGYL